MLVEASWVIIIVVFLSAAVSCAIGAMQKSSWPSRSETQETS